MNTDDNTFIWDEHARINTFFRRRCAVALEMSKSSINSAMLMNSFSRISEWLMVKRFNGVVGPI